MNYQWETSIMVLVILALAAGWWLMLGNKGSAPAVNAQSGPLRGFWKIVKITLTLSLLLLIGSSLSAEENVDALVMLPVIVGDGNGNQLPVAVDDSFQTSEDTTLVVDAANGVLANDAHPELEPLQAVLVNGVSHGVFNLNANGSFDYTPDPGFNGQDSFTYRASDGSAASNVATVMLTVIAVNDTPVAADDSYQTAGHTTLVVDAVGGVLANDAHPELEPLQAVLVNGVSQGVLNLNANGSFDYTPDAGFNGQDSFTYRASDGSATSNIATVTLIVNGAPVAVDDNYQTSEDTALVVDAASGVLANDLDPELGLLQAVLASGVSQGVLNLNVDGSFDYMPNSDFNGQDSFTYQASDGAAASNIATVTIIIELVVNSAPQFVTGGIGFTKQIIGIDVKQTHSVGAADLDRDGDLDVVGTDYVNGRVLWYENDGNGNFLERTLDADLAGAYPSHVGDVDGDGHADVLAGGYLADTFVWYRNDGGGNFTRFIIDDKADGAHSIVTVDLDEDGDIDLVTSSQDAGTIAWYENDGNQNFRRRIINNASLDAKRAEVADMDGDGDLDIVTASYQIDEIAWLENDGNENFTKHVIDDDRNGAYYASPADIDGQGNLDLLTASKLDNTIAWYRNDDVTGFEDSIAHIIDGNAIGARTVIAVDIDGDGDMDALATSREDDTVAWHENDGNGNFTMHVIDGAADGAYGVFAIDMDFDGDVDVLSASRNAHTIALHSQTWVHAAAVAKGGTLVINSALLLTVDIDDVPADLTYTITAAPEFGQLRVHGVPVAVGGTFTQDDVNNGRLTYVHNGVAQSADDFSFTVADGGESGVRPAAGVFTISVTGLASSRTGE